MALELDRQLRLEKNDSLFASWHINRSYTKAEIESAKLFLLKIKSLFEICGDECGTQYDYSNICPKCRGGSKQIGSLKLNLTKVPQTKDISRSLIDDWVISERLADIINKNNFTGVDLKEIIHTSTWVEQYRSFPSGEIKEDVYHTKQKPKHKWYELCITSKPVVLSPLTIGGNKPSDLDENGEYKCDKCGVLGLNLISEAFIEATSMNNCDFIRSHQSFGQCYRRERKPLIFVSPRVYKTFIENKIKGCKFEIAHLV